MARKKKFKTRMISDKDGIRFATPEPVAEYRAQRLQCRTIADISCGIGGQALYFAKYCDFVYAIEIDPVKISYAKKNAKIMGVENIQFITGDALSREVIAELPELDVVFSDPARPPTEKERSISNLRPSIPEVMKAYSDIATDLSFEAPPQISPERISFDCEKEYMSLEGKLNRLNLYFGKLKKADVSAVSLPGGYTISSDLSERAIDKVDRPGRYAYEVEECVTKAGLLAQLASSLENDENKVNLLEIDEKRTLLTADLPLENDLFKNRYVVQEFMEFDLKNVNSFLRKRSFGKVMIRASIEPESYWEIRNALEKGLTGDRKAHLFVKGGHAMVCEVQDH